MTTVISKRDLERMRAMAFGNDESKFISKDDEKIKLSQERMNKWPNTLIAIRKKKENFAVEKKLERERMNQLLDLEEEKLRAQQQKEALDRAASLMLARTDNMKLLSSQKLLSDVIYTREYQIEEKQRKKDIQKQENEKFQTLLIKKLNDAELAEKLKIEERKKQIQLVSETRFQQFNEVKAMREKERLELMKLGAEFKEQAKLEFQKEMKQNELRMLEQKQQTENMLKYNENLKKIQDELRLEEEKAQALRAKEVADSEAQKNIRKRIELDRKKNHGEKRLDLIEKATQQLNLFNQREEEILLKQEKAIREKLDQLEAAKAKKLKDDLEATIRNREAQIQAKKQALENEKIQKAKEIALSKQLNEYEIEQEDKKRRLAKEKEDNLKRQLHQEAKERKELLKMQKERLLQEERELFNRSKNDNVEFTKICLNDIKEYKAKGKPIYPLEEALARSNLKVMVKHLSSQDNNLALNVP